MPLFASSYKPEKSRNSAMSRMTHATKKSSARLARGQVTDASTWCYNQDSEKQEE